MFLINVFYNKLLKTLTGAAFQVGHGKMRTYEKEVIEKGFLERIVINYEQIASIPYQASPLTKIAVIDYGLGNLRSIRRGLEEVGAKVCITHRKAEIRRADALVLPGVGAFEEAIKNLKPISQVVRDQIEIGKPLLGICLGLQLLFTTSTEGGLHRGLNILKGKIVKLPPGVKVPHMGWNTLKIVKPDNPLFEGVPDNSYAYFVHSYYAIAENENDIITKTTYGVDFPSTVSRDHVLATQFHPERSAMTGLQILKNFVNYIKS